MGDLKFKSDISGIRHAARYLNNVKQAAGVARNKGGYLTARWLRSGKGIHKKCMRDTRETTKPNK